MNLIIWVIVVVVGVYIYKTYFENTKKEKRENNTNIIKEKNSDVKKQSVFNVEDVPAGYEIYEDDTFFVHGVKHRFNACVKWAQGENHKIFFKREPKNKYDSNAIAIFGTSSTGKRQLGYIASEIADDLVYKELDDKIIARLISVEIKETPFIEYEILVKSDAYNKS